MTKTSEFSWKQEEARGLMNKFKEFWSSNPQNYGITGGTDAATGDANAKNLFNLMLNHGSVSRKARGEGPTGGLFFGAGTVWEELEDLVSDKLILEDEVKQFDRLTNLLDRMEGTDKDPRNIVFRTVVSFDGETDPPQAERDEVRGHYMTEAYWNFRKDKAERTGGSYNMPKPKPEWVSLDGTENEAEPPLWRIIFGKKNSLRSLIQEIKELTPPVPPPIAHLDVKINRGKTGRLADITQVQQAVRNVLEMPSIYPAGKSRAPTKSKLNEAMSQQVIATTPEMMRLIGPDSTVLVENDGRVIRRGLDEFPDYEEVKSITLNFPKNNIILNRLIREVLGEEMDSFERPNRPEDGPLGLVLKAEEADLIREASFILKRVGFEIRDPEGGEEALGATRYDDEEGVKADVFLANSFRDLQEDLALENINIFNMPENILNQMTPEQRDSLENVQFNAIVNTINETVRHESTHWGQLTEPAVKEKERDMNYRFVNWAIDYIQGEADENTLRDRLSDIFAEEIYFYIYKEVPAYWIQREGVTWGMARDQVRRAFVFDNPIMKKFLLVQQSIREASGDENFQLLPGGFSDRLEIETVRIFNVAMDSLAERDNNEA